MRLAIMQPYFLPYIGYFQLIKSVNQFIIYDDVNYIKQGWINRNKILVNGKIFIFNLNISDASSYKHINHLQIGNNKKKLHKTISEGYVKAPFYNEIIGLVEKVFSFETNSLSALIINSIQLICEFLEIKTKLLISSELAKDNNLKGETKVISICKIFGAKVYINSIGGLELYSKDHFKAEDIELFFLKPGKIEYRQFNNLYVPNLSIIDVLMFNSKKHVIEMLDNFELI